MKQYLRYIWSLICVLVAGLLTGCGNDAVEDISTLPKTEEKEIRLNAYSWQMMNGNANRRAITYDNQAALQTEGAFTCAVYEDGTTTEYIPATQVDWNSINSIWEFHDGKHYWPSSGNLDFFAYMPAQANLASKAPYIGTITYVANAPSFTCKSIPTNGPYEFVYALTNDQNKSENGASGVTMTFKHPFARIYFKLSDASGTAVTINSISISGTDIATTGTYTHNSGWSSVSGTGTLSGLSLNTPYIVIPKNYGNQTLTVNATWTEWSNITKDITATVAFDWAAGTSYTYTLTLSKYALKVETASTYTEQW